MTAKDLGLVADPWELWPDGIIPAEGGRQEWRLRTPEEGKAWLEELAGIRKTYTLPAGISSLDAVRRERDER